MSKPLINLDKICFSYDKQEVLKNVDLVVGQGDFLALIGPNGGGKSTLLKLILSQIKPKSGEIFLASSKIAYVAQETNQNKDFPITVQDVVLSGLVGKNKKLFGFNKQEKALARQKLDLVGIKDLASNKVNALSGGQRQRMMIARALISEPDVLLLDEPTSNIDPSGQTQIFDLLKKLNKDITIVVVSHDISLLFGYTEKIAHVNKEVKMHTLESATQLQKTNEHLCEVELIQSFIDKQNCEYCD